MKSRSTLPREFAAKSSSKPNAVKKAMAADKKADAKIAKKYGVKSKH